ncbi:SCO2583 family membrane protein [Streptomyces altiplanensis]
MAGRGEPPEGPPEGLPGGSDDEYRSVVFDESFVRAARLQEFSAQERMNDHAEAVRSRPARAASRDGGSGGGRRGTGAKQALALVLVVALAFAMAVYLGVRHPYQPSPAPHAGPLRMSVVPLAPESTVPGGAPAELFEHSPAARFRTGAEGIALPAARRTAHFSEGQVLSALTVAKDYLVASSLAPDVLKGSTVRPVRVLLDPGQLTQFDRSFDAPAGDGRHAATGWLVRFDPVKVALAAPQVRVRGVLRVEETESGRLEVTSDHTFVYALRPAGDSAGLPRADGASLFTVRRELHFRFDRDDLRMHRAELLFSYVQAGPQACSADAADRLRPVLAGQRAADDRGPAGTDPYTTGRATTALCGTLAPSAMPSTRDDG